METQIVGPLSRHAGVLLAYLAGLGGKWCIGQLHGIHHVIPSPAFNWDGRYEARVLHPECISELVTGGFLATETGEAGNTESDYAGVARGHVNHVYVPTAAGRRRAASLKE